MNNSDLQEMGSTLEQHNPITRWENNIKRLVEDSHIREARQLLSEISKTGAESPTLKEWQIVLEPPKVSIKNYATGVYFNKNFKWLQKNYNEFKDRWVALREGVLIDSHESLITLRRSMEHFGNLTDDIVFMEIEK